MTYNLNEVKILLVEDMPPMLALTKSILKIFGFKDIEVASDGQEAFRIFQQHKSDLIITDWLMEPVGGLELLKKVRKSPNSPNPCVPIIFMTGFADMDRVESARDGGVTEFLIKPFTAKDMYSRIVQVIEKPRQFVNTGEFFGPDRRRRKKLEYYGPKKRTSDKKQAFDADDIMLTELTQRIKDV